MRSLPTGRPAHGDLSHMPRNSEEKFMSRYMDEENSALFPFGWGLSYTRFSYSQPTLSRAEVPVQRGAASGHKPVTMVGVDVKNTGSVAGTEVVQLYIRNTDGQRGAAGARAEGLCAGHACAGRDEARRVSAGIRRAELL